MFYEYFIKAVMSGENQDLNKGLVVTFPVTLDRLDTLIICCYAQCSPVGTLLESSSAANPNTMVRRKIT